MIFQVKLWVAVLLLFNYFKQISNYCIPIFEWPLLTLSFFYVAAVECVCIIETYEMELK